MIQRANDERNSPSEQYPDTFQGDGNETTFGYSNVIFSHRASSWYRDKGPNRLAVVWYCRILVGASKMWFVKIDNTPVLAERPQGIQLTDLWKNVAQAFPSTHFDYQISRIFLFSPSSLHPFSCTCLPFPSRLLSFDQCINGSNLTSCALSTLYAWIPWIPTQESCSCPRQRRIFLLHCPSKNLVSWNICWKVLCGISGSNLPVVEKGSR